MHLRTGMIFLAEDTVDYEKSREYFLTVQAQDGRSPALTGTALVNVTIEDSNDNAPQFSMSTFSAIVSEDAPIGCSALQVGVVQHYNIFLMVFFLCMVQPSGSGAFG